METFQEKLKRESSKIIQWQVKKDLQFKQMKQKLQELEELVERQRKSLLQQQMNCEEVSQEYANEVKHQEELKEKVQHTLKISGILQEYFQSMNTTFVSFEKTRDNLVSRNDSIKENYEQLIEKFNVLHSRHLNEANHYRKLLNSEREQHTKNENQWQIVCNAFEQKLKEAGEKILHMCCEKNEKEQTLKDTKVEVQLLSELKERASNELAGELVKLKELLSNFTVEKQSLLNEIDNLRKMCDDYTNLRKEFEASTLQCKKLETDLCNILGQIPIAEAQYNETKCSLEEAVMKSKEVVSKVSEISAEVEQAQSQVEEERKTKEKLEDDLVKKRNVLNQKMTDIELLQNNSATEMSKLSELLKSKEKNVSSIELQLSEHMELQNHIQMQIQELMSKVNECATKAAELQAAISAGLEKLNSMKEMSNQLEKVTEALSLSTQSVNTKTGEKSALKSELETRIKDIEQAIKNKEMDCSRNIKDILSSMEEYKQSYISKLSEFEAEKKKLLEKTTCLEKDNRELMMEKKIWEEKVIYHENLVTKIESRKQILESQVLQLKAEIESEKSKTAITNLSPVSHENISESKDIDSDSPKSVIRQERSSTQKKTTFDNWSDTSEDSCLDIALYQVDNAKRDEKLKTSDITKTAQRSQPASSKKTPTWERTKIPEKFGGPDAMASLKSSYTAFSQPLQSAGTKFFRRGQRTGTKFYETNKQDVFTALQDD
ncbi:myosin-11-like [Schistocerca nitens]|uniref:myosin-11-like n=1 Tax=Schistocerca nitens TaxID=7011 RepID=UPI002118038D|nr:myosin-11-like [Schistocerca nitens]